MEDTDTHTYHYTDEYVGYRGREHAAKSLRDALDEVVAEVRRRIQKSMNPGDATTWLHCRIERSDHCRDGDDPHAHYCNARDENRAPPATTVRYRWTLPCPNARTARITHGAHPTTYPLVWAMSRTYSPTLWATASWGRLRRL